MRNPSETSLNRRRFLQATSLAATSLWFGSRNSLWGQEADKRAVEELRQTLLIHSEQPLNAEPKLSNLVEDWLTPIKQFYVRNHGATPTVRVADYQLTVEGMVHEPLTLTLAELKDRFNLTQTTATLTCAGNRRREFSQIKKVGGVQWDAGAIGNAEWQGVRLSDVLKKAGIQDGAKHVWFTGLDQITERSQTFPFGGSVPLEKAMSNRDNEPGTLLAWQMNQQPLTAVHGFPLRTVVPGYIGARSVKWLGKITVSDRPSPNHFVADAYKLVQEESEARQKEPIYEFPLNSAICVPASGERVRGDKLRVRGYALAAGKPGRSLKQVEVSSDDGETWKPAEFLGPQRDFCWRLWQVEVPVGAQAESLLVRATDDQGHQQPRTVEWNLKGYLYNGWHEVPLKQG